MRDRYKSQQAFHLIGEEGQRCLKKSKVAIIGLGGLGTAIADKLARAGVGFLRLIDRGAVVFDDLHRHTLYTEEDALRNYFKARAAAEKLQRINSLIKVEPLVTDFNGQNCDNLLADLNLAIAAVDNPETRWSINQTCLRHNIPWINGEIKGNRGMTMSMLMGPNPCYLCYHSQTRQYLEEEESHRATGMIAGVIGTFQATEALKILLQLPRIRKDALLVDLAQNTFRLVKIKADPHCPSCSKG